MLSFNKTYLTIDLHLDLSEVCDRVTFTDNASFEYHMSVFMEEAFNKFEHYFGVSFFHCCVDV